MPWVAAPKGNAASQVYDGGTGGFCGQPPQANGGIKSALPSNETFGVTGTNGTGSAEFDVFTTAENTTLGCSDTVACSLVAVPIMGISCDASPLGTSPTAAELADLAVCEETGHYAAGASATTQQYENGAHLAVTGSLWWSPSNWRNRITVPLTFAPPANACSIVNGKPVVDVYGSTLMLQATDQWEPSFCAGNTDKFSFVQVASPEPEARSLVATGAADAAFTSYAQTGGYGRPVVNAPVAMTGFTISYAISGLERCARDDTQADAPPAGQAADRVLPGHSRLRRPGIEEQPAQHHHRSGVQRPQSRRRPEPLRVRSGLRRVRADLALQRLGRDRGAHDLHQRHTGRSGLPRRDARHVDARARTWS